MTAIHRGKKERTVNPTRKNYHQSRKSDVILFNQGVTIKEINRLKLHLNPPILNGLQVFLF
jgi:hypothetical protein